MGAAPRPLYLGATILALLASACGGAPDELVGPPPPPEQTTGTIQISVTTSGPALDPDGYTVRLDGAAGQPVGAQGRLVLDDVPVGSHTLEFAGFAMGCDPLSPLYVDLAAGDTARISLEVHCPGPATLRVITHSTGAPADPDGYLVHVSIAPDRAIGIEDTIDIADLPPGSQSVTLSGLAPNCTVAAPERILYLPGGQTTTVTYQVDCTAPDAGIVVVSVSTVSINAPAALTFTAVLDDLHSLAVASTGTATFRDVTPGVHSVRLRLPFYCGVGLFGASGTNPVRVTVLPGAIQNVQFNVLCIG
jgi:hypothetical protein